MNQLRFALPQALVLVTAILSPALGAAQSDDRFVRVTDAMLQNPSPDDWLMLKQTCARVLSTMDGGLAIYRLAARMQLAPGAELLGTVRGISAETGETAWLHEQRAATYALVTTGGGLVFGGDGRGRFRAFDQDTGEVLWEVNLGSPVTGFPITYAVDGTQYVVASTGARREGLTPELRPSAGNNLFVFALPD